MGNKTGVSATELQPLGGILSEYHFEIPDYQRGYAWKEPQWESLWQDIQNIAKTTTQQHFTGMMLLRPCENTTDLLHVEVVDGQQRLVTAMILVNRLRRKSKQEIAHYHLTFKDNKELQNYFNYYALIDNPSEAKLSEKPSSYAQNIKKVAEYFEGYIKDLSKEQSAEILEVVLNKLCLYILVVSAGFDMHIAFETLNNRGRRLSKMELLKNRLIYLTTILKDDLGEAEKLRCDIHAAWKRIYLSLGRSSKTQNHDDEFLLAHATAYFKKKHEADWLEKTLFENTFSLKNQDISFDLIRSYIKSLGVGAAWWSHIHAPEDHMPKTHLKLLNRISHAGFAYFKPLLLSAYMRATENLPEPASFPSEHENSLESITDLLTQVERFIVIIFRLLGNSGNLGKADIDRAAYTLLQPGRDMDGYLAQTLKINGLDNQTAILLVADFLKAWVDNKEDDEGNFTDNRFQFSGNFTPDKFQTVVEGRFRDGNGYYKWDFTRIALYEYEEHSRDDGCKPVKASWDKFSFDDTVEHIYPQTPDGSYWNDQFKFSPGTNRNGKIRNALQNSLGNLLLLSRQINSEISNAGYKDVKREVFKTDSYSAVEVASVFTDWNAQSIAVRGVAILRFIEKRWKIDLTDDPKKLGSYLPLCFGDATESIVKGNAGKKIVPKNLKNNLRA